MKYALIITTSFLSLIIFDSCTIKCHAKCDDPLEFGFLNFDSTSLDSVIVTSFIADGKFDKPVNSIVLNYRAFQPAYHSTNLDSMYWFNYDKPAEEDTIYDWQVFFSSINKIYRITDIKMAGDLEQDISIPAERECVSEHPSCQRTISSCKINGNILTNIPKKWIGGDNVIYIQH